MASTTPEVHSAFRFAVKIGGEEALFTECTLPSLEVNTTEQKEGGYNKGIHMLPGPVKSGRITLKRGIAKANEMLKWYLDVASGKPKAAERNISVIMYDSTQKEVLRLEFVRAYPVKWTGPTFKTADSTIAIETLELAFAEFQCK
jgi:phage tail-like protein